MNRKYQEEFITYVFASAVINSEQRPQCAMCCEMLLNDSFKVSKLI
jgi:hypothetical protein